MELEIHPRVGFSNSTRLAMFNSLSKPNFDKIARSPAVLLLLRSRDMEGCQNFKSRSCDPFPICKWGVAGDSIFEFPDPDLPIHYITFMELR